VRPVRISEELVAAMRRHARTTYPLECCGYLFAPAEIDRRPGPRTVSGIEAAPNEYPGERRRRFEIRPADLRDVERRMEGSGQLVAGFYHSHPDHPARPSAFDEEHAWPWYTYLILGLTARDSSGVGAFELDAESGRFHEVRLEVVPSHGGAKLSSAPART
jgi:proteasome lid subunit RPN8/RPN11